jgi:hypothetical protein
MFLDVPEHDARSDVFSLAATIYTVLAGRTPFEVPGGPNTAVDLMARIERGQLTPMERDDVPRSLLAALATAMSPRREDRFPSALEFGRALQRVELESGLAATTLEIADTAHAENLVVESPDAAETRVRSLPTVVPDAPAPPEQEQEPAISAPDPAGRASSAARLVGILVGVFSLLVVAAVVLAVVLTGGPIERPDADPAPSTTGGSAVDQGAVAPAVDGTATRAPDGTAVTFAWTNPDPHEGDLYYWALSETPDSRQVVEATEVTVDGVAAASRVCVNVEIGRAGRTSEPLRICTE